MDTTEKTDDTSAKIEEIRERWASNEVPWPDEPNTEPSAPEDIAFLLDRVTALKEERDEARAEVERLKALTHMEQRLSCPDCEWSGHEGDLVQKMSGALCPSCSRVLKWTGGLRVSVAEPKPLTIEALRPLMVEGWEMPEAPEDGAQPAALWEDANHRWVSIWTIRRRTGFWSLDFIPWPFREGVTVTAEMLRALGFTVEEG